MQCVIACALYSVLSTKSGSSTESWSGMYPCLYSWFSAYVESSNFKEAFKDVVGIKMEPSMFSVIGDFFEVVICLVKSYKYGCIFQSYFTSIGKKVVQGGNDNIPKHNTKSGDSTEVNS